MKRKYIAFLAAALALTACGQEEKKVEKNESTMTQKQDVPSETKNMEESNK